MTRIPLWHSIKHLCQDSSPLLRHLSSAPQSEHKLYSCFSVFSRGLIPSQNSSEAVAANGAETVSGAKASASGRDAISQPLRPSRWHHTLEQPLRSQSAGRQQATDVNGRSTHSAAAATHVLPRSSESCLLHNSSQAASVLGAQLPAAEGTEERSTSRNTEPAWLGKANVARREREKDLTIPFSAKAFYVGKDMNRLLNSLDKAASAQRLSTVWRAHDSKMICLSPQHAAGGKEVRTSETYLAIFNSMDTVVFFNGRGREVQLWKELAGATLPARNIEEFKVEIQDSLFQATRLQPDSIALKHAQPDQIKTIAYLLAQTVALHFYEMEVDTMLKVFQDINMSMERTGEFGSAGAAGGSKAELLRMVASNNVMRTGILSSKIGLTKRFEAAWKDPECDLIYEHLRREMEIDRRYEALEDKFDLIQDNLKYFLEIIQNRKSDFLEYMIVLLIAAEICVSLFDMYTRV